MEKFNAMRTRLLQHLQKKAIRSKSIMTLVCLLLASASAFAQTKTVTGTVTDAANEPLIGASVLVQGTSTGTITDMDGKYSISVTPEDVLAFSYVGMTSFPRQETTVPMYGNCRFSVWIPKLSYSFTYRNQAVFFGYITRCRYFICNVSAAGICNAPTICQLVYYALFVAGGRYFYVFSTL